MSNEIRTGMPRRSVQKNVRDRYTDGTGAWLTDCSNSAINETAT
jgi:hypothetical protein